MQINGAEYENSLYRDALAWAGASATDFPFDPDFVRNANLWLDLVTGYIMEFDGSWKWDDANRTTLPIGTGNLVSDQDNYSVSVGYLKLIRVRVKDQNGNWITLKPIQRRSLSDSDLAASGTPTSYYKLGNSIFLTPIPNYALTGGIEIQVQKGGVYFTTDDTTKEPGYAPHLHRLNSLGPALDYLDINGPIARANAVRARIGVCPKNGQPGSGLLGLLAEHYSSRDYDQAPRLELEKSNRGIALL